MARIREQINLIENAVAGQRVIIKPAVGRTWLDAHVEHGGLTLAQMKDIKVQLVAPTRTVTLWTFKDGVELDEFNKRLGRKTKAGTLSFYFRKPEMETEAEAMASALGTGGLQSLKIEFDIASGTTPVIKAWGRKAMNRSVAAGVLSYIVNHNTGGNAEGENHYDSIDRRDRIASIHVLNDAVDLLELRVDDATAFKLTRARCEFEEEGGGRVPYADDYGMVIDFMLAGTMDEALIMQSGNYQTQEMRLTATLGNGASAQVRYLVEYVTKWENLVGANVQRAA